MYVNKKSKQIEENTPEEKSAEEETNTEKAEEVKNVESIESVEETKVNTELGLTSLKIDDWDLSPEFKSDVYTYRVSVNKKDVSNVNITAIANKEDATVLVEGAENIVDGENVVDILVISGEEIKTYQIIVNKKFSIFPMDYKIDKNIIRAVVGILLVIFILVIVIKKHRNEDVEEDKEVYHVKGRKKHKAKH